MLKWLVFLGLVAYASSQQCCSREDAKRLLKDFESVWSAEFSGRRIKIGTAVFIDFLANVPDAKSVFQRVNPDDMNAPMFQAHVLRVTNGLDTVLNLLDNPAALESQLNHLSRQHQQRSGVKASFFDAFNESWKRVLPRVVSNFNIDVWDRCYKKIAAGISSRLP